MPRRPRIVPGGYVYHVLNRAVARLAMFEKEADYLAFERILAEALERHSIRLLSYVVMPNHWHLVLWPCEDGELTAFVRWLTHTHAMRWHAHFGTSGSGHLYQGRFKAFPVDTDPYLLSLLRYVERNPRRANLVERAEEWRWSSLWRRTSGDAAARSLLHPLPIAEPSDWLELVNRPQSEAEEEAIRRSIHRGAPWGGTQWQVRTAQLLDLGRTLTPRGRPRKQKPGHGE